MKLRTRVVLQLAVLSLALGASALAQNNAYLYIVHGIPGRDIAANLNPGLPIDISIGGKCPTHGLTFGNTTGPYTLAPGTYDVQISPANTLAPCTNTSLIDSSVTLGPGANVSAVAAISTGQPAVLTFTDNFSPVASGDAHFVLVQSADAPALQATLTQLDVKSPKTYTVTANPDTERGIFIPAGTYLVQVVASGTATVLTSQNISLPDQSATFSYAVGESANNSVGLVNRTIRDVF
jgi:hypothetical protein